MIKFFHNAYIKINCFFRKIRYHKYRKAWKNEKVTILSNFCIGGFIYNTLGMEFCSPTINLCFYDDDFYDFVLHIKEYCEIELIDGGFDHSFNNCPVGILMGGGA